MVRIKDWLDKERVSNRVKNCLRSAGYETKDLVWHDFHHNPKKLLRIEQFGDLSMANTEKWLRGYVPKAIYPKSPDAPPKQEELFTEPTPDVFDFLLEWMEKAATAIDLNTKTLIEINARVAHVEDMLAKSKKLNEFQALLKRWET
jgi:hypothetical protein